MKTKEEYAKVRQRVKDFYKNLPIGMFVSIKEAAKKFAVSTNAIRAWTVDIIRIAKNGLFKENGVDYASAYGLSHILRIGSWYISRLLKKAKVPYIYLYQHRGQKILKKTRFYPLNLVWCSFPQWQESYKKLKKIQLLPTDHILRRRPTDLSENAYLILCTMLIVRRKFDKWPSYQEIRKILNGKLSVDQIGWAIRNELIPRKYMRLKETSGILSRYQSYFIRKGPAELITRSLVIEDSLGLGVKRTIPIPRDFVVQEGYIIF